MAAFTGTSFPYWMSINSDGSTGSAGVQSENIPVSPGGTYTFTVTAAYQTTYSAGAVVTVTFYTAAGVSLGATSATQSFMTGGQSYQWSTGAMTAPATSAYAIALVRASGTPAASNALQVYQAEFQDGNNNQVNINFAFTYTSYPWLSVNNATVQWNYSPLLNGDADSLTLDGVIELMGGQQGVMSDIPQLLDSNGQGPTFRILAPASLNSTAFGYQTSYDLNSPQPTQDVVASMLLDGERPFGTRSSNRTISLPIIIFGTQAGGMSQVLKAREFLASIIDQQTWKMIWTSADTGLPLVFDCFRALPSTPIYGFNHSSGGTATGTIGRPNFPVAMMTIAVQALPYGRSDVDGRQNLAFTNSLVSGPQPNTQKLIDNYATTGGIRNVGSATVSLVSSATVTLTETVQTGDTVVVAVAAPNATAQTVTVTDTKNNTYNAQPSVSTSTAAASSLFTFTATAIGNALSTSDTITVHTTNSQNMNVAVLAVTQGFNVDSVSTNSGSSATPSVTTTAPSQNDNISIAFFVNANSKTATNPAGWNTISSSSNSGLGMSGFWATDTGQNAETATSSFSGSASYVAATVVVDIKAGYYWVTDSSHSINPGTKSAHFLAPRPMTKPWPPAVYTASLASPVNIAGLPALSMWFGQSYDSQWPKDPKFVSNVTLSWTFWDNQGRTLRFNTTQKKCSYGTNPSTPKWTRITARIPQGNTLFNYSALTAYRVRISNWSGSGHSGYVRMHAWLNGLYANPQTISNPMSPRGTVYNLFSLPGTARSPISVQCQLPAASNVTKEMTTPASGYWIVPPGVYSVQAECWAGGGAGASLNLSRAIAGGGGGGGEYAQEPVLAVTPGQKVPWTIGAAGTPAQLASTVVQYQKPGMGHWTCPPNVTQVLAECWGGGGAGGAGSGGGGGGEYTSGYVEVTPGTTYNLWVANGGKADTGTTSRAVAARQGGTSWFGPLGALVGSEAYLQAIGGKTAITGGSSGGLGGTGVTLGSPPQTGTNLQGQVTEWGGWTLSASAVFTLNPYAGTLPAGATGMLVITVPAPTTITVTDTSHNTWVQVASKAAASGSVTYVFMCLIANQLTGTSTVTINQGLVQVATVEPYNIPWVCGQDAVVTTANGSSSTPSITSGAPANSGDLVFAIFGNAGANTNSVPSGWTRIGNIGSSGAWQDVFVQQNTGSSAITCSPTYAASEVWEAIAITLSVETHWPGGRGGSAPGSSGGGGGGAAGATAAGGAGANSQPYVNAQGRWPGGAGGAGTGLGGNGGAGASTPGFPGAGTAPGGGGGGGYQNAPLFNASNPSLNLPGSSQVNYLGGDGGAGMVQLTYAIGGGNPVNGGNTTFGSAGTTTTTVTAHGGTSAASNSAAGGAGGTGSTNTIASAGGAGGLNTGGALGSYINSPSTATFFQALATIATTASSATSSAASSSCAQGTAVAVFTTSTPVTDSVVTDSAGNIYQLSSMQAGGAGAAGVTTYAYVADIEYPITTSTTLSWSSASSVTIGLMWYASPYLAGGVSSGNTSTAHGNGTTFSAQFGLTDTQSQVVEVALVSTNSTTTISGFTGNLTNKVLLNASSTSSVASGQYTINAFACITQAGGTGAASSGDTVAGTISGTADWSQVNLQFTLINQQAGVARTDWRSGTTPGAQSTWASELAISANGMILMVGQAGSGASITTGPTAVADAAGNVYTVRGVTTLPSNQGTVFLATAPVTAALAAGTTGTVNWGSASGAPDYYFSTYWIPNAVASIDVHGVSATTGSGTTITGSYAPGNPNDVVIAVAAVGAAPLPSFSGTPAPWNPVDTPSQAPLKSGIYAAQATDEGTLSFSATASVSSAWACLMIGLQMTLAGTGGGAAGGSAGPGYPGVWQYGGYGYSGGGTGKGGAGAVTVNTPGGGAAKPGGGGGGAYSNASAAQAGGQGAQGAIRLTWTPPLQSMNNLIVHSLGPDSDQNVSPICPIPITDTPNNTEYSLPSVNGLLPGTFNSTYSVILANYSWNNATSSNPRQITVTVNQYEYPGGPRYSVQVSRAITPATDAVNGLLSMGEVTLPVKDYIAYNDQSYFTVSINDTDASDRFMDVLFLDTLGQTILVNIDPGQPGYGKYVNFFIDEATTDRDLGFVGASFQDRQHQVSVLDYTQISGGALYIAAGDNLFLTYSTAGAPDLAITYEPRWYLDRIE